MNTFPGWRRVGAALRLARALGVRREAFHAADGGRYRWYRGDTAESVIVGWWDGNIEIRIHSGDIDANLHRVDATEALSVLVALRVLPAEYAAAYDYGREAGRVAAVHDAAQARETWRIQPSLSVGSARGYHPWTMTQ
jgi:hypothetical protein